MAVKFLYLDFEYNQTQEHLLNLVSVAMVGDEYKSNRYWLFKNEQAKAHLKEELLKLSKTHIFVAYNVVAEAGAIYSLGLNPLDFKWIDLYLEYRMLTNHCHRYMYGNQLINGKLKVTKAPEMGAKYFKTEDVIKKEIEDGSKPQHNLASAIYKMLGKQIDTIHKEEMRELIISNPDSFSTEEMLAILDYNESDILYLPELKKAIFTAYKRDKNGMECTPSQALIPDKTNFNTYILGRGEYACRTAIMERLGYPVQVEWAKNFYEKSQGILEDIMNEINILFPHIAPFEYNHRTKRHVKKEAKIFKWIDEESGLAKRWPKTGTGKYSLTIDVITKFYSYRHDYPKDNFGAQLARLLKTKQSLNGFIPPSPTAKDKTGFLDYIGSDGRVRSYFGIFGAQSGRNQPSSKSFIPLKSAWLRSLIVPKKGKAICGIDYSSQEFLLSAIYYNDKNMQDAYKSGDVYLYFAKLDKAVPMDGKKEEYSEIRDLYKSTVLGLSYLMTKSGLAVKLSNDTGKVVTEDDAQEFIDKFNRAFPEMNRRRARVFSDYQRAGHLKLPDGWYMFRDNPNERSVANFPIQGLGSSIMRKAVALAQDKGLQVIFSLHDALYIEYDSGDIKAIDLLEEAMREAFIFYFKDAEREIANLIRMDAKAWSLDYEDGKLVTPKGMKVETQTIYVDKRSKKEYEQFKHYLTGESQC